VSGLTSIEWTRGDDGGRHPNAYLSLFVRPPEPGVAVR
jgi:hypothetical protein